MLPCVLLFTNLIIKFMSFYQIINKLEMKMEFHIKRTLQKQKHDQKRGKKQQIKPNEANQNPERQERKHQFEILSNDAEEENGPECADIEMT